MAATTTGNGSRRSVEVFPGLPLDAWRPTYETLHMWTQIVGKLRLARAPPLNHWWQVPLYFTARGLTTSPIPCQDRVLQVDFDFLDHELRLETDAGESRAFPLLPRTVAAFYDELFRVLRSLDLEIHIWPMPVEVPDPIPFDQDQVHAAYDAPWAERCWRVLGRADRILKAFESRFQGKQSPSHFFWGSFDLAQTRFSGRRAPERKGADRITREAYSHEAMSFGFWPGAPGVIDAAFYAYAAPEPEGFREAAIIPAAAYYHPELREFVLPYESIRSAAAPEQEVLDFFQSVYDAGADLGHWDRAALDREPAPGPGAAKHPSEHPASS